jgi:hypothetical protein
MDNAQAELWVCDSRPPPFEVPMRSERPSLVKDLRVLTGLYFALLLALIRRLGGMDEPETVFSHADRDANPRRHAQVR